MEIKKLKDNLNSKNNIGNNFSNNWEYENSFNNYNNINMNNLCEQFSNNFTISQNQIKCVAFKSSDNKLFFGVPCSGENIFAEVEEKLYKEYPEYRETNNSFYYEGKEILRFKTINDNHIGNGRPITLVKPITF